MNDSRILLVEDDEELRQAMRAWLAPLFPDWTFEETHCAEAAIRISAQRPPALVLMDFKLPDLNGIEATRRIKAGAPQVEVIIVTVYEEAAYRENAAAAGAAGYVSKRRMYADLVPLLRKLLPAPAVARRVGSVPKPTDPLLLK